jgi:hypothetical protein
MNIREGYHAAHNYLKREKYLDTWTFWHTIIPAIGARVLLVWLEPPVCLYLVVWAAIMWECLELQWAPVSS